MSKLLFCIVYRNVCGGSKVKIGDTSESGVEYDYTGILLDFQIQTDKLLLMANHVVGGMAL